MSVKLVTSYDSKPNRTSLRVWDLKVDGTYDGPPPSGTVPVGDFDDLVVHGTATFEGAIVQNNIPFDFGYKAINSQLFQLDPATKVRVGTGQNILVIYSRVNGLVTVSIPNFDTTISIGGDHFLCFNQDPEFVNSAYYKTNLKVINSGTEVDGMCDIEVASSPVGPVFAFKLANGDPFTAGGDAGLPGFVTFTYPY